MTADPMTTAFTDLYARLRDEIGRERTERLGALSRRDIQRFAVAAGDPVPDPDASPAVAPPLYLSSVMGWGAGPRERDLDQDGTSADDTRGIAMHGVRLMGAGQDLEFHTPVREGMRVVVHTSLDDVVLKEGRSGQLLIARVLRRFTDDAGAPLVTCRETFIGR